MATPVFTVDSFAGDLKIDWTEPDIEGDPITRYQIEIADSTSSSWTEYTLTCDGLDVLTTYCLIPMSVLESAPYSYTQGQLIKVRARAHNSYGPGAYSDLNLSGVNLRTVP